MKSLIIKLLISLFLFSNFSAHASTRPDSDEDGSSLDDLYTRSRSLEEQLETLRKAEALFDIDSLLEKNQKAARAAMESVNDSLVDELKSILGSPSSNPAAREFFDSIEKIKEGWEIYKNGEELFSSYFDIIDAIDKPDLLTRQINLKYKEIDDVNDQIRTIETNRHNSEYQASSDFKSESTVTENNPAALLLIPITKALIDEKANDSLVNPPVRLKDAVDEAQNRLRQQGHIEGYDIDVIEKAIDFHKNGV
ncbi:MAG: hypothetical protein ACH34X_07745 [Thiolinea sp.]